MKDRSLSSNYARRKTSILLLSVLTFVIPNTMAWESWEVSGFASFGGGRLSLYDHKYIDFKEGDWGFNSDSVIGLQANKQLTNRWGFTAQTVANGYAFNDEEPYTPELEWMLLSYDLNSKVQIRGGRLRNPFYFYSTTQEVGYTYLWVRPPTSVYNLFFNPFKHFDGADITFHSSAGMFDVDYTFFAGTTSGEYEGIDIEVTEAFGGRLSASSLDTRFYLTLEHIKGDASPPDNFDALKEGFEGFAEFFASDPATSNAFLEAADSFDSEDQITNSLSTGVEWNSGNLNLISEIFLVRGENRNYSYDSDGYYASAGYRLNKITPYLVYGFFENRFSKDTRNKIDATEDFVPSGAINLLGVQGAATLDALRDGTRFAIDQYNSKQATTTLGFRYDFHSKADFKVEIEHFQLLTNGGTFSTENLDRTRPKNAYLISFVIDVVF